MKSTLQLTLALVLTTLLAACASKVSYDYDTQFNFSELKTYAVKSNSTKANLMDDRLSTIINENLIAKGFTNAEKPTDFTLVYTLSDGIFQPKDKPSVSLGAATGGFKPSVGIGLSLPIGQNKITHSLTFSVTNSSSRLIWQGQDTFKLNEGSTPEEKSAGLASTAAKILAKFPSIAEK